MHFLVTFNDGNDVMFSNFLLLIASIKSLKENHFITAVITGSQKLSEEIIFKNEKKEEQLREKFELLLDDNIEIYFSSLLFLDHPPVRWFVEPKQEVCVFLDVDMIACSSLVTIEREILNCNCIAGVLAHSCEFDFLWWNKIFQIVNVNFPFNFYKTLLGNLSPFYINFGFIIMTKEIFHKIKKTYIDFIDVLIANKTYKDLYFLPQISLALTIEKFNLQKKILPLRYNYPDYILDRKSNTSNSKKITVDKYFPQELDNIVFYHYMASKRYLYRGYKVDVLKKVISKNQFDKLSNIFYSCCQKFDINTKTLSMYQDKFFYKL